jgi:sugar phosphate isomerase/epimerase
MKLACADFAFPLLEHEQALALIAMLGVDGVDLAMMGNRSHLRPEVVREDVAAWTTRIRKRCDAHGLPIADFFLIPWTDFETLAPNHPDGTVLADAAELFRVMVRMAADVQAAGMTMLPGIAWPGESWEESFERAARELRWRVDEAAGLGVPLSVEPHLGSIADTPQRAQQLVDACPGLTLTLDYTHFVFQGIPEPEIEPLLRHARHFHARGAAEGRIQTTMRESTIDYDRVLDAMRELGYEGYVGLEYVWTPSEPGDPFDQSHNDNVSETILLRDRIRARLAAA